MEVTPRHIGGLALLALVPLSVYGVATGRLTLPNVAAGVINILLITVMLVVAFGPSQGGEHANGASH